MHPISNKYFGVNGIGVVFNNGSGTTTGYVVKQLGTKKFKVTSDGNTTYVVRLADNLSLAENLTAGYCTILINNFAEHIGAIWQHRCVTLEGNEYYWTLGTSSDGSQVIHPMSDFLPGEVTGLLGLAPTLTNANITWNAPTSGGPVTQYIVQYRLTGSTGAWTTVVGAPITSAPGIAAYPIFGLTSGDTYDVQVAAENTYGHGPFATLHNIGVLSLA